MLRVVAIVCAALFAPVVWAGPENATARALLADWKDQDPGMTAVAEVIASAFASGLAAAGSLGGREVVCPPSDLGGKQIMRGLERFVNDNCPRRPALWRSHRGVAEPRVPLCG